jgi:hypothetical protein
LGSDAPTTATPNTSETAVFDIASGRERRRAAAVIERDQVLRSGAQHLGFPRNAGHAARSPLPCVVSLLHKAFQQAKIFCANETLDGFPSLPG